MLKRLFDLITSLVLIILFLPIMIITAILIKLTIGSPVLFHQVRPGLHEKPFTLIKFRTMSNAKGKDGKLLEDHERLTGFGKFVRSVSLDELPQLFNVLKGELSLVGPRPLLMDYLPLYNDEQKRRHHVKPGITGWAQVNGRNAISWEETFQLDLYYVDNYSFKLDIKILWLTVVKVFKREGVAEEGHVTKSAFTGNSQCDSSRSVEHDTF
ncbi:sugar transferase [Salipaludibacillus agaradhaerens]|uniref:Sugar transferase n=1 Tax=Salipaludibacillus agaradhaerens TaxID=76935 RepID=A0A9Q4B183_SALAG|nr:sugar transferase [Salipaludibacillus agaradhaerens]MCR6114151.1 sugar transferase [Salipaludibacillus agaradhaerens]